LHIRLNYGVNVMFAVQFMKTYLEMSIMGIAAFILIVPLRFLAGLISRKCSFLLWGAFWLKLIFPFRFKISVSIMNLLPPAPVGAEGRIYRVSEELIVAGFVIWLAVVLVLMCIYLVYFLWLRAVTEKASHTSGNCYVLRNIDTAFVFGIIKPRIYIPENANDLDSKYMILHEKCHIGRGDYVTKLIVSFITVMHWFNPVVWMAFVMFKHDMEASCDELVLDKIGKINAADYAAVLVRWSAASSVLNLNFGGNSVKRRIKNISGYRILRKPVLLIAIVLSLFVFAACSTVAENKQSNIEQYETVQIGDQTVILEGISYEELSDNLRQLIVIQDNAPSFRISSKGTIWIKEDGKWVEK